MKVSESLNSPSSPVGASGKDDRKISGTKGTDFHSQLTRVENQNYEERLNDLVKRIIEQGEKLGNKIDIRELKTYKKLIAEFMDEAINNSNKFSKESFLDKRGRYRVYATIKKINIELGSLTEDVLKGEKDNISILKRLDDIRGLVLDIIM